jgi:hypothetical protein
MALGVVSWGVVTVVATVVGGDVAGNGGGSGCNRWGWGLIWGAVDLSGSQCWHSRGAGGGFGAGDRVVVVVVNVVANVDGGCAAVVSDAVADSSGVDGQVGVSSQGAVCVSTSMVVVVVCVLESIVALAIGAVCTSASILTCWSRIRRSSHLSGLWLVSQLSRSAVLLRSSPSFTPLL